MKKVNRTTRRPFARRYFQVAREALPGDRAQVIDVHASLSDWRRYERQIERLHRLHLFKHTLDLLEQDGVSLERIVSSRRRVAKLLARTVARGAYRSEPATLHTIMTDGKIRTVFRYRLTDTIVHGVVAELLDERMTQGISRCLYSYRPGLSWWSAVSSFAAYTREHRKTRTNAVDRGLYVLRRDIDSYTDLIPVGPDSTVWALVRQLLLAPHDSPQIQLEDWRLVESVIRPEVVVDGGLAMRAYGVPTGQPIAAVIYNLYLDRLDHQLDCIPGGFYARYSDDLLFAHPEPQVARQADRLIAAYLDKLGLRLKQEKCRTLYLTAAGRASADWPGARGTNSVPVLGMNVSADATVSLSRNKLRRLLRDTQARAARTVASLPLSEWDERGRVVCAALNRALDPRQHPFQESSAVLLRRAVTDRHQLRHIDLLLARSVVHAVTGHRGARAFRAVPYRTVRNDWGLRSLLHERNRYGK
jgi:hypothetical protein